MSCTLFSKKYYHNRTTNVQKEGNRVENTVLGFIGAGNMATAIINGIVSTETMRPSQIAVFDVNEEKCVYFKQIGVQGGFFRFGVGKGLQHYCACSEAAKF